MNYMLTNAGIELNAKLQSGAGAVLKITRAAGASGYSNNAGELSDLLNVKQTIQIEQIVREGITVTFGLILSNVGIEEEYILMQIGIYAEDPDTGKEILYIIGQDARGERVPAISEAQVEYKFNISQKISNTSSVVFETSPSDFLTKKVFTDFVDTVFSTHVNNKSNPHELTIEQLGAAAADHKHDTAQLEGILPLNKGGTGAANASDARNQLGAAAAGHKHAAGDITGGTLPVDRGGTGGATPTAARTNLGLGTAATQGVANNLTTTAAGYALDARQGKKLKDEVNQINSDLVNVNSNLGGNQLIYNESEDAYYIQNAGADTGLKKLGELKIHIHYDYQSMINSPVGGSKTWISTINGYIVASTTWQSNAHVYVNGIRLNTGRIGMAKSTIRVGDTVIMTADACPGQTSMACIVVIGQ